MRILFSSVPAHGHLLPLLPLARAAARAGHQVALLTHPGMHSAAPDLDLLPAGPDMATTLADVTHRTTLDALQDMARGATEFFVASRLNLGAEQALAAAEQFRPDLVVADMVDFLGRLVAAARGIPFAVHGSALPLAAPLATAFEQAINDHFPGYGVKPTPPVAYLDPWPDSLLRPTDRFPVTRIPIRPEPHSVPGDSWHPPAFRGRGERPVVLVTMGTVVEDRDAVEFVVSSLTPLDVDILVAPYSGYGLEERDLPDPQVHSAGFVPMKDLLAVSDLVVTTAGAGTVLSTLSAGLPMVLLPMGLDKPVNAERVAARGAGLVVSRPGAAGAAVEQILAGSAPAAAAAVAAEIAGMDSPDVVLTTLLRRLTS
ncbi:glycosyltransferase [Actinoplanes sp. NBRC 101535]|uniref:glycosyltransferase n=1 Tax=Actinoplanes sp. NBRC 101535 TaxID=3032196 RepID=UPI0024A5F657|nr:glycosyltransferase [Actinoplanes sp. NBRC 101535]GLY02311.1 glycosyl transferase [Actinoplanes sp. NBRC 101535]